MSKPSWHRRHVSLVLLPLSLSLAPLAVQADPPAAPFRQERGNLILEGIPPADGAFAARLERYLSARDATFLDWLPDGSMLVSTRFGNAAEVHRISAPLGMREQLTYFPEPITVAVVPQTDAAQGFAFLKDQGGDENAHVYYYLFSDRSTRLITDGKSRHGDPVWSRDGRHLAYFGNGRDGASYDIYVTDPAGDGAARLLVGGQPNAWYPLD